MTGRHPDRGARTARLGAVAAFGFASFILAVVALHFIQPGLDPLRRFVSEYAVGRAGWLMKAGFLGSAVGMGAVAVAVARRLSPPARSPVGGVLFGILASSALLSGIFDSDLQGDTPTWQGGVHDAAGLLAMPAMLAALILVSVRLYRADRLRGAYRALPALAALVVVMLPASVILFELRLGMVGLGQRALQLPLFAWLLLLAAGLRAEAFAAPAGRAASERPTGPPLGSPVGRDP